jgi:hypothetical protein
LKIVESHLNSKGFETTQLGVVNSDKEEYEYYGDPTRQDRRIIKCRYFDGIEAEVTYNGGR